jgi:hypothetical protein
MVIGFGKKWSGQFVGAIPIFAGKNLEEPRKPQ